MALNIKNPEVERLVAEVAEMTGESKTEAIRRAMDERKTRLQNEGGGNRMERLRSWLRDEMWPSLPEGVRGEVKPKEYYDAFWE